MRYRRRHLGTDRNACADATPSPLPPEAIRQIVQTYGELPNWPTYYNAAPTTALPVVRQAKNDGNRELVLMQWSLVPWFSKDGKPSYSTINARAEGIRTAASYREPFSKGAAALRRHRDISNGPGRRTIDSPTTSRALMVSRRRSRACGIAGGARTNRKPANEDVLVSRIVSKAVGNVKNNGPELLENAS